MEKMLCIEGACTIDLKRHGDDRGFFQELFNSTNDHRPLGHIDVRQVSMSMSSKGVVRGLHVAPFAKIVQCIRGELFDVIADVRKDSSTYLKWCGVWLDDTTPKQVLVPAGCAHGFMSTENDTMLIYFQDDVWQPGKDWSVNWLDPKLNIDWPFRRSGLMEQECVLSDKDLVAPNLP